MKRLLLLLMLLTPGLSAAELTIAAASSYRPLLNHLAQQFEQRQQHQVRFVFGSSGKLATQIIRGAPFDLIFSANMAYLKALSDNDLLAGEVVTDGYGQLVLWSKSEAQLTAETDLVKLLQQQRVAIAQPKHAPFGQAAKGYLEQQHIYHQIQPNLVYSENVAQAVHMVHSGAADFGFVALSVIPLEQQSETRMYRIALENEALLRQAHAVLKSAKDKNLANEFSRFVQRQEFDEVKRHYGIEPERVKN
ncbi:molybdate ABC transporter substrate-binding protein [Idiomarina seosinensis]|uniref:Molybdate ABC transporter substrate-binding protein n=1 Tax=Idiomarina seosinensis TaxID=281739 RepID=A0A432ZDY1_9GAMM|nr:molybdate ABC transporter substrate-binding protein [Idiomarina seosinensis]RUO76109.1 molybdate ABC transporter substrate-binding protein [Idiomarina seosinensis]